MFADDFVVISDLVLSDDFRVTSNIFFYVESLNQPSISFQ